MQALGTYVKEIRLNRAVGATFLAAIRLTIATFAFHMGNARSVSRRPSAPRRYRVKLLDRAHDLWLRTRGGDLFVLHEVFGTDCYALPGTVIEDATVIVDLGANVGLTTLYYAARAPRARIVAVEPNPSNVAILRKNVDVLGSRVSVLEAAIAAVGGEARFDDSREAWGGAISSAGTITVRALSLDDLIEQHRLDHIDVLKVDIEGGEVDLFIPGARWPDRVKCVVAELHHPYTFEAFEQFFALRGFEVFKAGTGEVPMHAAMRRGDVSAGMDRKEERNEET
jgi:FkbM family methyltransferase